MMAAVVLPLMLAYAQQAERPELPGMPSLLGAGVRIFLALVLVVAILVGGAYLMKKLLSRTPIGSAESPVRLIYQQSLGPRRSICLVKVLDKVLVLGVTGTSISPLMTLEGEETAEIDRRLSQTGPIDIFSIFKRVRR